MSRPPSSLQALFAELKRRHVFRVMAVYGAYGRTLREIGRTDESLPLFETLAAAQPGDAESHLLLGWEQLVGQRDHEAAEAAFRRSLALGPARHAALWGLARVHARAGRADSALTLLNRATEACSWPGCTDYYEVRQAWLRAIAGDEAGARERLERYEGRRDYLEWPEWLPILAATHAELGEVDRAFTLLDRAYGLRSTELLELKVEPWFDPLRDDPRFDTLLARMGLD